MRARLLRLSSPALAAGLCLLSRERRAVCASEGPSATLHARSSIHSHLQRSHTAVPTEDAMRPLKLALKGGRLSARISLPDGSMVLPTLLPLIRAFPLLRWQAHTDSSFIGETLVLDSMPHATGEKVGGSISVVLPDGATSHRSLTSAPCELELFAGSSLRDSEAAALASSLAAVYRATTTRRQARAQVGGEQGLADALGDLFGRQLGEGARSRGASPQPSDPIARLEALGVSVHNGDKDDDWDALAGGEEVRAALEDSLLLPLQRPEVYNEVIKGTRAKVRSPHAKSILFEGPPGTGKTSTARILSSKLGRPMVYLPLESVVSKWYGEAEQKLAAIFDACAEMGSTVIFLDEIDALATSREDAGMHEASRRSLSVLLRKLDGFEANQSTVLIAATNRPQDLDAALLSRFELSISFPPPKLPARKGIFALYAKHLCPSDLDKLAELSDGASGRDIRDVCESAERRWAAKRVRDEPEARGQPLPPVEEYIRCAQDRKSTHDQFSQRRWR